MQFSMIQQIAAQKILSDSVKIRVNPWLNFWGIYHPINYWTFITFRKSRFTFSPSKTDIYIMGDTRPKMKKILFHLRFSVLRPVS
jgi:hypothetical protein